jgi:hypothetical protein
MKIENHLAFFLIVLALIFSACNPDCESVPTNNVFFPAPPYQAGTELAIASNPPNFLNGRSILISAQGVSPEVLDIRFEPDLGASVVQLPNEISQNVAFWIDDPDCTENLIPIGNSTSLVNESFFIDNPFFITPTPPLIVIPTVPPNPPPWVVDAWFSPNNRDYCIWFKPDEDENGNEKSNLIPAISTGRNEITNGPPDGSAELAANCTPGADRFYHNNPVSGIIDKENNYIQIQIDRRNKDLGIEEFIGQFVDPSMLPDSEYRRGGACDPDPNKSAQPNIMFLTSLQTGRQLILFRGADE